MLLLALTATATATHGAITFPPVHVASTATPNELFAAGELRDYLGNWSSAPVALVVGEAAGGGPAIAVGYDAATSLGVSASALSGLKNDSYVISSAMAGVPKGSYVVSGGKNSQRGTGFAVYDFLRVLGCEFLAYDYTMAEECPHPPASLPSIDRTYHPLYEYRDNNEWAAADHSKWAAKLGYNGPSAHGETGSVDSVAYAGGFVHTSYALLGGSAPAGSGHGPPPDLFNSHREWFWPRNDSDVSTYGQLCWSNASLLDYLTKQARKTLQKAPDANIISISQNDNYNYCQSEEEMKIINEEGTPGGALFRAINVIASNLKDEFPNIAFDTLAYQWSRPAPKITKPKPNVIIRLCDIECNFAAPLTDPSNAPFQKDMNAWAAISNRTYIWNYVTSFGSYIQPFPNWYVVGPNIQYFAAHGVRGIFEEGSYGTSGGDMDALKDYVMGRMLWNVTLNPDDLIQEFLTGYFGEAAPFIREYMDTMHGSIADTSYFMHENVPTDAPFLTPMAVITSAQAFQNALKIVSGVQKSRVDIAKVSVYYVALVRWDEMQGFAKNESIPWPLEPTKEAAWGEFSRMWKVMGITSTKEGMCNYTCFKNQVFPSVASAAAAVKTDDSATQLAVVGSAVAPAPAPAPSNSTCIDKNHTMYVCACGGWSSNLIDCDFDCHCGAHCTQLCCKSEWCKNGSDVSMLQQLSHQPATATAVASLPHEAAAAAAAAADDASQSTRVSGAGEAAGAHLKYMSYYGFNPPLMHGWVNMGLEAGLDVKLKAFQTFGIPSFYGGLPAEPAAGAIFKRGVGLADGWEASLEALVAKDVTPNLGKDKALRGVFLGDEICCMNATCWETALEPVTKKLRTLLGPDALIYTNECANHDIQEVPKEFDLISVDVYAGFKPGTKGMDEVTAAKKMYDIIFPKLHDHQKVMLVPGTFACSNLTYFPLDGQAKNLVEKLDGYFEWAKSDERIAGFNPWHFNNRSNPQSGPPCDMELGAVAMPSVYKKLQEIGKFILGNSR